MQIPQTHARCSSSLLVRLRGSFVRVLIIRVLGYVGMMRACLRATAQLWLVLAAPSAPHAAQWPLSTLPAKPGRTAREVQLLQRSARSAAFAATSPRLPRRWHVGFARSSSRICFEKWSAISNWNKKISTNGTTADYRKPLLFFDHRPSFSRSLSR